MSDPSLIHSLRTDTIRMSRVQNGLVEAHSLNRLFSGGEVQLVPLIRW